jgi:hypothetical protein
LYEKLTVFIGPFGKKLRLTSVFLPSPQRYQCIEDEAMRKLFEAILAFWELKVS